MNKKRKIAGKKRKKKSPLLVLSQIFFIRLKPFFSFMNFRMLSVSQKNSIEQKMTILETSK